MAREIIFDEPMKAAEASALTTLMSADLMSLAVRVCVADSDNTCIGDASFLTRCTERCGAETACGSGVFCVERSDSCGSREACHVPL